MPVPNYCTVLHTGDKNNQVWHIVALDDALGEQVFDKLKLWDAWGVCEASLPIKIDAYINKWRSYYETDGHREVRVDIVCVI